MRQIKASEVKPGMEVEFTLTRKMMIHKVITWGDSHRELRDDTGHVARVDADAPVTVLSEPAPPQPEEPTAFGARVVADGMLFVRADDDANPWRHLRAAMWVNWRDVCALGEVTVIDADPSWTLPAQVKVAPVVPERIEEWPKNDEHLRAYRWADEDGGVWRHTGGGWQMGRSIYVRDAPKYGPWTRVTDA